MAPDAARCGNCGHFSAAASDIEDAFPGLRTLSSVDASVRSEDGLCARHDRYIADSSICAHHLPDSNGLGRMPEGSTQVVAIVGSGFSGTATAIRLLRQGHRHSSRVVLIERGPEFGRGVAYAKSDYPYLLNVPASRMSATASDPDEFLRFARTKNATVTGEDFLPRRLYGEYLQHLLQQSAAGAPAGTTLECLQADVVDLQADDADGRIDLRFADGTGLAANIVVLALGSPPAALPAAIRHAANWPALRNDPRASSAVPRRGPMLIIGTGLTMVDVVCAAVDRDPDIEIHALSRHGLVPPSQTQFRPDALADDSGMLAKSAGSARRLVAEMRRLAAHAERSGGDWREAVTLVRRGLPFLWSSLPIGERARFLRHARAYWDVHRHRIPGIALERIDALRRAKQLHVHAGRLVTLEERGDSVLATWLARRSGQRFTLDVAEVVNCTGPDYDVTRSSDPLWKALLARGMAVPDQLCLGIRTATDGALLGRDGIASTRVFYVGPMLRADHWEATAVGELRVHAQQLANHLLDHILCSG
jgi:uncharacterized NAD(P)/FAD-binding protein YdhS